MVSSYFFNVFYGDFCPALFYVFIVRQYNFRVLIVYFDSVIICTIPNIEDLSIFSDLIVMSPAITFSATVLNMPAPWAYTFFHLITAFRNLPIIKGRETIRLIAFVLQSLSLPLFHSIITFPTSLILYLRWMCLWISLWQSRQSSSRLSQLKAISGTLMFSGVKWILWCTITPGVNRPFL